jgi:hypothetical protein
MSRGTSRLERANSSSSAGGNKALTNNGQHVCDAIDDTNSVCVAHKDAKTGEIVPNLHRVVVEATIQLKYEDWDKEEQERTMTITAHGSRPAHNHRLLNSETRFPANGNKSEITFLIRKEAPCDSIVYLELWIDTLDEPHVLEATGNFAPKQLMLEPVSCELRDVTGFLQATVFLKLLSDPIDLQPSCKMDGSLSSTRKRIVQFTEWYQQMCYGVYEILRPRDKGHWYVNVRAPHGMVPLALSVSNSTLVVYPKHYHADNDRSWRLIYDLAFVETLGFGSRSSSSGGRGQEFKFESLGSVQQARVINYMFALPFAGFTYVLDRVRRQARTRLGSDMWNTVRSRPREARAVSLDCEDAALYILESIYAFRKMKFQDSTLVQVQKVLNAKYDDAWLGISMLKLGADGESTAHAFAFMDNMLIEGTALTDGVITDTSTQRELDERLDLYNLRMRIYDTLASETDVDGKTVVWSDFLQSTTFMEMALEGSMYFNPITAVSQVYKHQLFMPASSSDIKEMVCKDHGSNSGIVIKDLSSKLSSSQQLLLVEWHPISWIDTTCKCDESVSYAYACACGRADKDKDHTSLLYYTSISFYQRHKDTIHICIEKTYKGSKTRADRFCAGRELDLVRICVCVSE